MKSVHVIGLGMLVGALALGSMVAVMTYRWQVEAFPKGGTATPAAQPAQAAAATTGDAAKGKASFESKCAGCHSIGGGKLAGPDLKGVTTQRPHDWLVNFITAPDKVIASGDPTATALVKEYGVPMPNLGISTSEANDILAHIASQSGGTAPAAPAGAASPSAASSPIASPGAASPPGIPAAPAGTPEPMIVTPPPAAPAPAASTPAASAAGGAATTVPGAAAPSSAQAAQGKTVFDSKCAGCHSIGGGKLAGPDLKGVTTQRPHDWLVNFITAPDKVIASGDPTATALVKEYGIPMPNLGISRTDADAVLAYIAAQSGGASPSPQAAAPLPPGNPSNGLSLFAGEKSLANGGPPCLGCHNANGVGALGGGSRGLDLTHAITKTGAAGVTSIMKSPPFPGMTEAFASHPITDSDAADLVAFLTQIDTQQTTAPPGFAFPLIGLGVLLLLAGLVRLAWPKRSAGVRRQLVGGRSK